MGARGLMRDQLHETPDMILNPYRFATGGGGGFDDVIRNEIFTSSTQGIQTASTGLGAELLPAWQAFDGTSEHWQTTAAVPVSLDLDFGEDQFINSVGIQSKDFRYLIDFTIDSSPDASTWTIRHTVTGAPDDSSLMVYYTLDDPATDRHWRIRCTLSFGTGTRLQEVQWRS